MAKFTLVDLQDIARDVLGDSSIILTLDGNASNVPGWDSLQHTLIVLEINQAYGVDLEPRDAANAKTFGALVELVNQRWS